MKKDILKYWCEAFRLETSGTAPELKTVLKQFSADTAAWDR
jgi:hypothetical protein